MYFGFISIYACRELTHKTLASLCCKFNSTGEVVLQHENARVLKEPLASTRLGHGSPGCSPSRPTYVSMSCSEGCSRDGAPLISLRFSYQSIL